MDSMNGMYEQPGHEDVTRFPTLYCVKCGHHMDAASATNGERVMPRDGDYTMCLYCCEPQTFVFGATGISVRVCTPQEAAEFEIEFGHQRRELLKFLRQA